MKLVEQHIIKRGHKFFKECDELSFKAKNLYNQALYRTRQSFFETGIVPHPFELQKQMASENQIDFRALKSQVSKQVLRMLGKNWKSYREAIKSYNEDPSPFLGKPRIPKYKRKEIGRFLVEFPNPEAISIKSLRQGILKLSGTAIEIPVNKQKIKSVRIVPCFGYYSIEVIYEREIPKLKRKNKRIASIDIGVNNLAAVTFNTGDKPLLINGRPIKSINQYFNKHKAKLQSYIGDKGTSRRIEKLSLKRRNKIKDYLHKASTKLANHIASLDISQVVVGKNKNWKQDVNIGRRNNQNFVSIPFTDFISMLKYKLRLQGVRLKEQEESYTSKCSFLDLEPIEKHEKYLGRRIKRGLFKSGKGILINSDINGSYNIGRKSSPELFDRIEGLALIPRKLLVA